MKMRAIPFVVMVMILGCQNTTTPSQERNMDGNVKAMTTRNETTSKVMKPPIDLAAAARTETATFALGWFWGPDSRFGSIQGVVRTRVGYAGGTKQNPTYHELGDHTETIQVDYDPAVISYEKLLEVFWDSHDPAAPAGSRQYMSIIFFHNDEQKRLAEKSMKQEEQRIKRRIITEIRPIGPFYLAEGYHQKYLLDSEPGIAKELRAIYASQQDYVNSTAVARINGYLGGYGTLTNLEEILPDLGLSSQAKKRLTDIVSQRPGRSGCRL